MERGRRGLGAPAVQPNVPACSTWNGHGASHATFARLKRSTGTPASVPSIADHGTLSWPNLSFLLSACVRELKDAEDLGVSPSVEFDPKTGKATVRGKLALCVQRMAEHVGKKPEELLNEAIAEKLVRSCGAGKRLLAERKEAA